MKLVEKIIYRGTTEQSFSNQYKGQTFAGLFYGPTAKSVKGWGTPKKFNLLSNANIFEYESSDAFCYNQGLYNKEYRELKQLSKIYGVSITTLNYFTNLSEDQQFTLNKNIQQVAGSLFCWYDLWTWCTQLVARIELEKRGYDGALWKEEDFGNPIQYQIWNLDVVKTIEEENLKNNKMTTNTFRFKLVENTQQLKEKVDPRVIKILGNTIYNTSNPPGQGSKYKSEIEYVKNLPENKNRDIKWAIHHADGNHGNNSEENLYIMPNDLHSKLHSLFFSDCEEYISSMYNLDLLDCVARVEQLNTYIDVLNKKYLKELEKVVGTKWISNIIISDNLKQDFQQMRDKCYSQHAQKFQANILPKYKSQVYSVKDIREQIFS